MSMMSILETETNSSNALWLCFGPSTRHVCNLTRYVSWVEDPCGTRERLHSCGHEPWGKHHVPLEHKANSKVNSRRQDTRNGEAAMGKLKRSVFVR
eukprot:3574098-Amphidinium_carterae.1